MLDNIEFMLKILFFILSVVWIGKILVLRTDKQIVINPLLIAISAILVVLPQSNDNLALLGMGIQNIRIFLYIAYSMVIIFGIYATSRKNGFF